MGHEPRRGHEWPGKANDGHPVVQQAVQHNPAETSIPRLFGNVEAGDQNGTSVEYRPARHLGLAVERFTIFSSRGMSQEVLNNDRRRPGFDHFATTG